MKNKPTYLFYTLKITVYAAVFLAVAFSFLGFIGSYTERTVMDIKFNADKGSMLTIYYRYQKEEDFTPEKAYWENGEDTTLVLDKRYILPENEPAQGILIVPGNESEFTLSLNYSCKNGRGNIELEKALLNDITLKNGKFKVTGSDPYILIEDIPLKPYDKVKAYGLAFFAALVTVLLLNRFVKIKALAHLAKDLYESRNLILSLAVNDFKTRFAGSYFGIVWAFVQPVCTILVFWFVFQIGFRNSDVSDVPFILWFMAGLIPWFFFSEGWSGATMSLQEYSYLVKKVVFKVHILPLVKIISAFFVHIFFVAFMFAFFLIYGVAPKISWIQVIYYSFSMVMLVISLGYITSVLEVFFKDMGQIMNIVLQFGMWLTPIMWQIDRIPKNLIPIFKLNPMYYIVQGYRESMIYGSAFYNNIRQTAYFWGFVLVCMIIGSVMYKKLKPHFADVL